jgi:hypothetical protein
MFRIESIAAELREESRGLDDATFDGRDAARLAGAAAEAERLCAAIKLGFAKRAADTNGWKRDSHATTSEQWLARTSGCSEGQARDTLRTAERLAELPATEEGLRDGSLSMTQASLVSKAASANPASEGRLLRTARREGLHTLRDTADRVIAAATDETEAHATARRERHLRTWRRGLATHGSFSGPTEEVAELVRALEPLAKSRFDTARKAGERVAYEARMFDALIDLAKAGRGAAGSNDEPATTADQPVTRIRVDLGRLLDHDPHCPGEVCEIPGVGPVPVAWARQILPYGLLELVITDGVDVRTVVTRTRYVPEALQVAISERDQRCKIRGCDATHGLERHHTLDFAEHRLTTYELLGLICGDHHDQITYGGYTIVDHDDGTWSLRPPAQHDHERQPDAA